MDRRTADANVQAAYDTTQTLARAEQPAQPEELAALASNWQDPAIPALQRRVADVQLENLRRGVVDPVFEAVVGALGALPHQRFSLLDAACASGYYREVIEALDSREIRYSGCDYSPGMIEAARARSPETSFEVQDLTALTYQDQTFDVVLLSGVLEHVPGFEQAIANACRVARTHVIAHRVPLTRSRQHEYTLGAQYNIETPRIFFSRAGFVEAFARSGFEAIREADTYRPQGRLGRLRRLLERRSSRTFVFERSRSS